MTWWPFRRKRKKTSRRSKKINPMNVRSNRELLFGHSLTHSKTIQKSWGRTKAKQEHARLVRIMRQRGIHHRSPLK